VARGWLLTLVAVAVAGVAAATPPCEEDRGQTGLALGPTVAGLAVTAVDESSAAAAAGVLAGDDLLQVHDIVPHGCGDYGRAVREARRDHKALLILVRRGGKDLALALGHATWEVAVAAAPPTLPVPAPSVRPLVAAPPPPLPSASRVTVDEVLQGLAELAPSGDRPPRTGLDAYRRELGRLHAQVGLLGVSGTMGTPVAGGLATVLAYHDAASTAWAADEIQGERTRRPRQLPPAEHVAPYFTDSEPAAVLDRFPFLRDTIVREPARGVFGAEAAGVWRPLQARALLWEHARAELALLSGWLAGHLPGAVP
jgi:hypothetical protein